MLRQYSSMNTQVTWEAANIPANVGVKGNYAKVGKWNVGYVGYNTHKAKKGEKLFNATLILPGEKTDLGRYKHEPTAVAVVEQAVADWFKGLEG